MTIHVTAEDIAKGTRRDDECCPVALAIRRVIGEGKFVSVVPHYVDCGRLQNLIELPKVAVDFITAFDDSKPVAPFTFELDIEP